MAKRLLLDGINPKKRRKYGEGYNYKNNDFYSIRFTGSASQRLGKLMQNRFFVFFKN